MSNIEVVASDVARTQLTLIQNQNQAPSISLSNLQGQQENLELAPGAVSIVHFWATWCTPCLQELPDLIKLSLQQKANGLRIILVAADSHTAVHKFMENNNIPKPVLIDQYGSAMRAFHVQALPSSYIIDHTGKLHYKAVGQVDWNNPVVMTQLKTLLNENYSKDTADLAQ